MCVYVLLVRETWFNYGFFYAQLPIPFSPSLCNTKEKI